MTAQEKNHLRKAFAGAASILGELSAIHDSYAHTVVANGIAAYTANPDAYRDGALTILVGDFADRSKKTAVMLERLQETFAELAAEMREADQ